ncbi:MAG: hypothetical protein AABZ02_10185 [Bacteroidota bacterium]
MLAKLIEFIVVCIHSETPLIEPDLSTLREKIIASKPHYWEETEPGIFLAFFLIKAGGRTKSLKLTASIGSLKKRGSAFYGLGVAKSAGELVTESTWYGKIITCPFGDAVNKALKQAREAAQKEAGGQ